jgi:hypothetical protein
VLFAVFKKIIQKYTAASQFGVVGAARRSKIMITPPLGQHHVMMMIIT